MSILSITQIQVVDGKIAEGLDLGVQTPLKGAGKSHIICMWLSIRLTALRAVSGQGVQDGEEALCAWCDAL